MPFITSTFNLYTYLSHVYFLANCRQASERRYFLSLISLAVNFLIRPEFPGFNVLKGSEI